MTGVQTCALPISPTQPPPPAPTQAFYYGHHQFLVFFPIAYYHSWNLWKFATVGLVLWFTSRVISRVRGMREVVVKSITYEPAGITALELCRKDFKPLFLQVRVGPEYEAKGNADVTHGYAGSVPPTHTCGAVTYCVTDDWHDPHPMSFFSLPSSLPASSCGSTCRRSTHWPGTLSPSAPAPAAAQAGRTTSR